MAHCEVATQLYQEMLGNASHYMDIVNCQIGNGLTWHLSSTDKEMKKKFPSTNNVECGVWFCHDDIKYCVSDNKNECVMDLPIVLDIRPLKIISNTSREKALAL
jgi:hypothetical protein